MSNPFTKAARQSAKLKLAITGPSGSGKTTAALRCARGLVGPRGKIAVIDTENRSASLYSDITDFDVLNLEAPFEHGKFSDSIKAAESHGYNAVVIDSASHLWEAILAYKDKLDRRGGNSYTNWSEAGGKFKEVIDCLLAANLHVISCMRSKMEHTMEKDDKGRTTIRKVGMAPVMRDGIEYEFTLVLDLDMQHQAASSKDRTRMFDGKIIEITETVGAQLAAWLDGGEPVKKSEPAETQSTPAEKAANTQVAPVELPRIKEKPSFNPRGTGKPVEMKENEDIPMFFASDLEAKLPKGSEDTVNAYLVKLRWIKQGETVSDLPNDKIEKIMHKLDNFLRVAGVTK